MICPRSLRLGSGKSRAALSSLMLAVACIAAPVGAQMTEADVYHHVIKPQEDQQAAATAEIMSRPPNWGPGEIRSNANYGAIAWYEKSNGQYGYIFARGFISPTSVDVQMSIECDERKVACEGKRLMANKWFVIGKHTGRDRFVTAAGETRAQAEMLVQGQCQKEGGACTIEDAFDVMPHKRGISNLRPKVIQR